MNILYLAIFAAHLLAPGIAIANAARIQNNPLTFVAISYSLFVITYVISNQLGLGTIAFYRIVSATLAISIILCATQLWAKRKEIKIEFKSDYLCLLGIILSVVAYHGFHGAFAEVPADVYSHLERFQSIKLTFENESALVSRDWESLLTSKSYAWYHLLAIVAMQASATNIEVLESSAIITNSVFLIAVYLLGITIFREAKKPMLVAIIGTVFTATHLGINIFSFVRYYSLAPTTLGFCLYFWAIDTILKFSDIDQTSSKLKYSLLIVAATFSAAINHTQEALFIAVMLALISLVHTIGFSFRTTSTKTMRLTWATLTILAAVVFVVIYIYANLNFVRGPNISFRLWSFAPAQGLLPELSTLNLKFQFIQVVTLWGLFVYALFFLNLRRYKNNAFLLAGMISPIFTVMNPFFVDLFLRLDNATTLWRLCYIIPIHYVAADLFICYSAQLKLASLKRKVISFLVITPLIALLLPMKNTWNGVHYSRFPTLNQTKAIATATSYRNYTDLLHYLESLETQYQILTDPMLGYMISGLTDHYSERRKFFRNSRFKRFSYLDYSNQPIDKYAGHLLITNQRTTIESATGRLSNHWRAIEWTDTKNYYPNSLFKHLEQRPEKFKLLWSNNGVSVFEIQPKQ